MSALKAPLINNSSSNIRLNGRGNGNVPHWRSAMAQPAGDYSRGKFYTLGHFPELLPFSSARGTWCQPWPRSLSCHSCCHEFCAANSAQLTQFGWISGWFQHTTPHSRQRAPGAVLAALTATFGSVIKAGAAAAGKCGVSSTSAGLPPSWPREGEEQLFGFWNVEKFCAINWNSGRCNRNFGKYPAWRAGIQMEAQAGFEEELDGGSCPIKSKPETLQFNWKLLPGVLFFKRILGKKREEKISQLSNASKVLFQWTLHLCVFILFILGIFLAGLAPRCAQWQSPQHRRYPTSSWAVPDQHKYSQHGSKTSCSRVSNSRDTILGSLLVKFAQGMRQGGREEGQENRLAFPLPRNSPLVFHRTQRLLWPNSCFCQPNRWYLKKKDIACKVWHFRSILLWSAKPDKPP